MEVTLYWSRSLNRPVYLFGDRRYDATTGQRIQTTEIPDPQTSLILTQEDLEHGFVSQPLYLLTVHNTWCILVTSSEEELYAPYYSVEISPEDAIGARIVPFKIPVRFGENSFEEKPLPQRAIQYHHLSRLAHHPHYGPVVKLVKLQNGALFYDINDYYSYDAVTLVRLGDELQGELIAYEYMFEAAHSQPVYIDFSSGDHAIVANGRPGHFEVLDTTTEIEFMVDEDIEDFVIFSYLDLTISHVGAISLHRATLPEVYNDLIEELRRVSRISESPILLEAFDIALGQVPTVDNVGEMELYVPTFDRGSAVGEMEHDALMAFGRAPVSNPTVGETERNILRSKNALVEATLAAIISRLYQLEVERPTSLSVAGITAPFISFEEAIQKFQRGEIVKHLFDPLHQVYAGPIGTNNRVLTLYSNDGSVYVVLVRFDPQRGQIFSPLI